jgi:hypothetical protein
MVLEKVVAETPTAIEQELMTQQASLNRSA